MLFGRSWWLNEMPHPAAAQDGLLLVSALFAGACMDPRRWSYLLKLPLLLLPLLILQLGPKPWTPNPLAGPNQCGYLLGFLLIVALAWFWAIQQSNSQRIVAGIAMALSGLLVWQTGSRAALVASLCSVSLIHPWHKAGTGLRPGNTGRGRSSSVECPLWKT